MIESRGSDCSPGHWHCEDRRRGEVFSSLSGGLHGWSDSAARLADQLRLPDTADRTAPRALQTSCGYQTRLIGQRRAPCRPAAATRHGWSDSAARLADQLRLPDTADRTAPRALQTSCGYQRRARNLRRGWLLAAGCRDLARCAPACMPGCGGTGR